VPITRQRGPLQSHAVSPESEQRKDSEGNAMNEFICWLQAFGVGLVVVFAVVLFAVVLWAIGIALDKVAGAPPKWLGLGIFALALLCLVGSGLYAAKRSVCERGFKGTLVHVFTHKEPKQ
jgi:hypothetical protein